MWDGISGYSKNFVKLVFGTAGAQTISFITLPILTRMYEISDFGMQALYMSIVNILAIVITGRYELAILLPKDDDDSFSLVIIVLVISLAGCVGLELIVHFCSLWLADSLYKDAFTSWFPFLALTLFVQVNYNTWYTWLNRNRAYNMMSRMAVIANIFNFLSAYIYGYFTNADSHGLLINTFFGMLVCSIYMMYYCKKNNMLKVSIKAKNISMMLYRYKRFPSFLIIAGLIETGSTQLPFLILNMVGGTYATGLYAMAYKIMQVPVGLVGKAMGNVFVREASESWTKYRNCWKIYYRTIKILMLLGLIPFGVLFLGGDILIPKFLGDKWQESSLYIAILCPMFYMMFISSPLSQMVYIAEKTKMELLICTIRFLLVLFFMMGAFWIYGTIYATIIWFGIGSFIFYMWQIVLTSKWAKGESVF